MSVETTIRNYLNQAIADEIDDDDDIFQLGVVTSLFAMQLVQFVQSEFSICVEREDLDINNFCSINAVLGFVRRKLDQRDEPQPGAGHAAD